MDCSTILKKIIDIFAVVILIIEYSCVVWVGCFFGNYEYIGKIPIPMFIILVSFSIMLF